MTATIAPAPTMTAATRARYGGPEQLRVADIATPTPGPAEVLVRVRASSFNFGDGVLLTGRPRPARLALGLRRPKHPVVGLDFAGEIAAVGADVQGLAVGDRVFGEAEGAHAQYVVASPDRLARIPAGVDVLQAGAAPVAGVTALLAMELAGVKAGDAVLINGASGGVGHYAVQIARHLGAEVTAVCSGRNRDLVRGLGAAHVVDYTAEDFTATDARYDAVLDLVGASPLGACRRLIRPGGTYIASAGRLGRLLSAFVTSLFDRRVKVLHAPARAATLDRLAALLAAGAVRASFEHEWRLDQIADAMSHQLSGRTRGKCALRID